MDERARMEKEEALLAAEKALDFDPRTETVEQFLAKPCVDLNFNRNNNNSPIN
jgi:hypothetical protein